MERFICVHGHFYQPPRENPWLETVEVQDSAAPYHDWNERIAVEAYAPNSAARILDGEGRIARIVNNYARISFNFGPTLLAWMQQKLPEVHDAIVEADRESRTRFSGHGNALAQAYSHMILPLANARDKYTQILWGIRDFERRFGRAPEGMWLPETAADLETLDTLAELGIRFTILSPFQASRIREINGRNWREVNGGRIDPTRPYLVRLPSGRTISAFFYDGPVSQGVAFEKLLESGERFATRLMSAFSERRRHDQLVHIATDGESYGHHHRYGEMALAYALEYIENNHLARLTNYGEYLETHPPTAEVQIHEKSAWSCSHGVGRWMADCGCNGGRAGWGQAWRGPLRDALDWLRDRVAPEFETAARELVNDPWRARNDYVFVILDRSPEHLDRFLHEQSGRTLAPAEVTRLLKLLELQRHAMLMYTSCGWFFDELSGIETVQVVQYAARVIQLARDVLGLDLEPEFLDRLALAKSNLPEHCDGRCIYDKFVRPAMIDWPQVTAHYAISSVFTNYPEQTNLFVYRFEQGQRHDAAVGKARLATGRTRVWFETTRDSAELSYAVLYLGEHNVTAGVRAFSDEQQFQTVVASIQAAFEQADFPEAIRLIDRHFGEPSYSLRSLFKDEQRRILDDIMSSTREDLDNRFRLIAERYAPLMRLLEGLGAPLPSALRTAADFILHVDICREIAAEHTDVPRVERLWQEAQRSQVNVFDSTMDYTVKQKLEQLITRCASEPNDLTALRELEQLTAVVVRMPLNLNLWKVQNTYWRMLTETLPQLRERAAAGDARSGEWIELFLAVGRHLKFAVERIEVPIPVPAETEAPSEPVPA